MWRDVALSAPSRAFCGKSACPIPRTTCGRRWSSMPRSPPTSCGCSRRASIRASRSSPGRAQGARRPRSSAAIEAALRAGRKPRRGPHPAPLRQRGAGRDPHQFLSDRRRRAAESSSSPSSSQAAALDGVPLPRPLYEIFVYSPRVEGVHLRFGKVARGGIRWSDRPQDFRTEILGLVKAQQVKNAVIVPVGAKGGFVPKLLPQTRAAQRARRSRPRAPPPTSCSSRPCSTSPTISPTPRSIAPANVVRHDDDDPYLVVAADKGTATFSDIANAIAQEHRFWLDDAFASGGSAGYDHKKMGITARGAWESVKRHFREMDVDIGADAVHRRRRRRHVGRRVRQRHAAGENDQARRRLRSPRHLHRSRLPIPREASPSAGACSICRARAGRITTARSSPTGGGVFSRALKEIALSPQARAAARHLRGRAADPAGGDAGDPQGAGRSPVLRRHRHLSCAPSAESDDAVGDRANDAIRVTGAELRAKVIGEGANLGMTQRGRDRGGAARHPPQHRCHRQLGRREHLRHRGQSQDRAGDADARRPALARGPQSRCLPT